MSELDWLHPPEDWLGAVVPLDLDVGASEDVAMVVTHATVYSKGFSFGFTALTTKDPGTICEDAMGLAREADKDPVSLQFHFGVEFADGRRADRHSGWISIHGPAMDELKLPQRLPPDSTSDIYLQAGGAGSHQHRYSADAWVWPLPPPGPLTFWIGWPAADLPVHPVKIDAASILNAASSARPIWRDT